MATSSRPRRFILSSAVVAALATLAGECPEEAPKLTLDQTNVTIEVNNFVVIEAESTDPLDTILWQSANSAIATVFQGNVTGISEGETTVTATGSNSGLTATAQVTVIAQAPRVAPGAPEAAADASSTGEDSVTVNGTTDPDTVVEVDGGAAGASTTSDAAGAFSLDVTLQPDRLNRLFVTALGPTQLRSAPTPLQVTQDSQEPDLFIDFPANGAEVFDAAIDVTGRVADMLSGFMGLEVTVNGVAAAVDVGVGTNGTFVRTSVPLNLGANTIEASATDLVGNTTTTEISVTRSELTGARISAISGNAQMAMVNTRLADPIIVDVMDETKAPVAGCVLTWRVTRSDGRISDLPDTFNPDGMTFETTTDANGRSTVYWTLGTDAGMGNNRLEVTAACAQNAVFFCASSTSAPPVQINVGSGNNQKAEINSPAMEPLKVWVSDGENGVAGVPVTFTLDPGDGFFNGQKGLQQTTVETSDTGHAEVTYTLGDVDGHNRIVADFEGNMSAPAAFDIFGKFREFQDETTLVGRVLDNASCPLGGATVELALAGEVFETATTDDGNFVFDDVPQGFALLHIMGQTVDRINGTPVPFGSFPALEFELNIVPNTENTLGMPILLPRLNPNNRRSYDGTQDVVLTVEGIEGLKFTVKAGSATLHDGTPITSANPITLSVDQVHTDEVPMPAPDGAAPPFAYTFQPPGVHYDPPVAVEMPNIAGLAPGQVAYTLAFNHTTGRFEIVASNTVSEDGSVITTDPGSGIPAGGWGANCPPYTARGKAKDRCGIVAVPGFSGATDIEDFFRFFQGIDLAKGMVDFLAPIKEIDPEKVRTFTVRPNIFAEVQLLTADTWLRTIRMDNPSDCPQPKVVLVGHSLGGGTIQRSGGIQADARFALDPIDRTLAFPANNCFWNQRGQTLPGPPNTTNLLAADLTPAQASMCPNNTCSFGITFCLRGFRMTGAETSTFPGADHGTILGFGQPRVAMKVQEFVDQLGKSSGGAAKGDVEEPVWINETFVLSAGGAMYQPDNSGYFFIDNISTPDDFGIDGPGTPIDGLSDDPIRMMGVGQVNGETWYVYSEPFQVRGGGTVLLEDLIFTQSPPPVPASIDAAPSNPVITEIGGTTQMQVTATLGDGTTTDISGSEDFTTYRTSNIRIASVDSDGLVTAMRTGTVFITATNFGATSVARISIVEGDELTTVSGSVETSAGDPVADAEIALVNLAGVDDSDTAGAFSIPTVPVTLGNIVVTAQRIGVGAAIAGVSSRVTPVPAGTTDAGAVVMRTLCEVYPGDCADTDNDGVRDAFESQLSMTVGDSDSDDDGIPDGAEDVDSDGLSVLLEDILGTNPAINDTDQDGLSDGVELQLGTSPTNSDTDGDGVPDSEDDDPLSGDSIPPAVALTNPAPGASVIEGETLTLRAEASDNGAVARVEFRGNGAPVGTDTAAPYEASFTVPTGLKGITVRIEAIATDTNDNTATTGELTFPVIADPLTTVIGVVLTEMGDPAEGAAVTVLPGFETTAGADGSFTLANVPTISGDYVARATFGTLKGRSNPTPPVREGTTDVGEITVRNAPLFEGQKYPVEGFANDVAVGDLDKDGALDVVTALQFFGTSGIQRLRLFMGAGDGSLLPSTQIDVGMNQPESVAIIDLDEDTNLDIVTGKRPAFGSPNGVIGVFLGNGNGGFGGELVSASGSGDNGKDLAFGDVDDDGDLDLVVAANVGTDSSLAVMIGNGDGTFSSSTFYASGTMVVDVELADIDEDGALDILELNNMGGTVGRLFNRNDGSGTFFDFEVAMNTPTGRSLPTAMLVEDFDGDENVDLAVVYAGNSFSSAVLVALGNGDGTFREPVAFELGVGAIGSGIARADLNQDGLTDLVVSSQLNSALIALIGNGDGTFEAAQSFPAGLWPVSVAAGDMDADGDDDAIASNAFSQDVFVSFSDGAGNLTPGPPSYPTNGSEPVYIAAYNVNGDAFLDVVITHRLSDEVGVFIGKIDGTFGPVSLIPVAEDPTNIVLGNFDADSNIDLIVPSQNDNTVGLLLGNGDGTFDAPVNIPLNAANLPSYATGGRFNADAFDDVAVAVETANKIVVLLGNGDATFQEPVQIDSIRRSPQFLTSFDVDQDGNADLLSGVNDFPGGVDVYFGNGDGTFDPAISAFDLNVNYYVENIEGHDLDEDGFTDIVIHVGESDPVDSKGEAPFAGGFFVVYGREDGAFTDLVFVTQTGPDPAQGSAVDLDGDGILDLVAASGRDRHIDVYIGAGGRDYLPVQRYNMNQVGAQFNDGGRFVVYDVNNDGANDIVAVFGTLPILQTLLQIP